MSAPADISPYPLGHVRTVDYGPCECCGGACPCELCGDPGTAGKAVYATVSGFAVDPPSLFPTSYSGVFAAAVSPIYGAVNGSYLSACTATFQPGVREFRLSRRSYLVEPAIGQEPTATQISQLQPVWAAETATCGYGSWPGTGAVFVYATINELMSVTLGCRLANYGFEDRVLVTAQYQIAFNMSVKYGSVTASLNRTYSKYGGIYVGVSSIGCSPFLVTSTHDHSDNYNGGAGMNMNVSSFNSNTFTNTSCLIDNQTTSIPFGGTVTFSE